MDKVLAFTLLRLKLVTSVSEQEFEIKNMHELLFFVVELYNYYSPKPTLKQYLRKTLQVG